MPSAPQYPSKNPIAHIRYESPYGGHPILRRKAQDAYAAVEAFLRECTDWDGTWPDNTIQGQPAQKFITADDRNDRIIAEFEQMLGRSKPGITSQVVELGDDFKVVSSVTAESWSVPADLHHWAVKRVLEAPPAKRGWPDALSCTSALSFRLREPGTRKVLPGQSASGSHFEPDSIRSGLLLHISSGNTSAFFDLVLPFAAPDSNFVDYVSRLRPHLPIRLAKGNFKHYVPNRAMNGYNKKRVDASLLADI